MLNIDPNLIKRKGIVGYLARVFVATDDLGNAIIGGDPKETISSRAAKDRNRGRIAGCILCKILDWIDKDHCDKALDPLNGKKPGQYDPPKKHK
jgi:hypothetical protein